MIWESEHWKDELARLEREFHHHCWNETDESAFQVEKCFFIGAFIVKKLIESNKTSDKIQSKLYRLDSHDYFSKRHPDQLFWGSHEDFYNFYECQEIQLDAWNISSEIIHSKTIIYITNNSGKVIQNIGFASSRNAGKRILMIGTDQFSQFLSDFSNDEVTSATIRTTPTGKMEFKKD
jgi:hypothetical protein